MKNKKNKHSKIECSEYEEYSECGENLLDFYKGRKPDKYGRRIYDILSWGRFRLEITHNYIQRLFPLMEKSKYDPSAPILNNSLLLIMRNDTIVQKNMKKAYNKMRSFYFPNGKIKRHFWVTKNNHNYKRLTRMLKSLKLMCFFSEAEDLFALLSETYKKYPTIVGIDTYKHWQLAMGFNFNKN